MSKRDKSPTRAMSPSNVREGLLKKQIQGKISEYQALVKRLNRKRAASKLYVTPPPAQLKMEFDGTFHFTDGISGGILDLDIRGGIDMEQDPSKLLEVISKFSAQHQCEALERLKKSLDDETEKLLGVERLVASIDENWLKLSQIEKPPAEFFNQTLHLEELQISIQGWKPVTGGSLHLIDAILTSLVAARK